MTSKGFELRIISDIHIDRHPFTLPELETDPDNVLIIAGDVSCDHQQIANFINPLAERFKAIIYTLGNHENFFHVLGEAAANLRSLMTYDNIHILDGEKVVIDDISFIGATLWTDYDKQNPEVLEWAKRRGDYQKIKMSESQLVTPQDLLAQHLADKQRLLDLAKTDSNKKIVITHHSPTLHHVDIAKNPNHGCWHSDLESVIEEIDPIYWVYGHTHTQQETLVGNSIVICNPRGYPTEQTGFITDFTLKI